MKKVLLLIAAVMMLLPVSAQEVALWTSVELDSIGQDSIQYTSLGGRCPILVEDIERITYEKDSENADVMVVYMKDGSVLRPLNNNHIEEKLEFCKEKFVPFMPCSVETFHQNNYVVKWNVSDVWKREGRYIVCISWGTHNSYGLENKYDGICIGTVSDLTIENSEHVLYMDNDENYVLVGDRLDDLWDENGHILVRLPVVYYDYPTLDWKYYGDSITYHHVNKNANHWLKTSLDYGKTYYYRPFIKVDVLQNGGMKPMVFYGDEKSFRVPYVMEDAGYNGNPIPTEAAMMEFDSHFPDTVTAPTWETLEPLWVKWQQTEEAKQIDMSTYYSPLNVFDNGTIYSITHIPDEFYTWLTHREIFIDPYDGIVECNYCNNDWVEVIYPDASWNVPGGKYVRATPRSATVNPEIKYHCAEVIPGVSYKLQVIFAPETLSEDTLPSKVFVDLYTNTSANRIFQNEVISAEEVTTLEADNIIVLSSGMDVAIRSHVSSKEKKDYNRVLRVAGIRLIPVDN